MRLDLLPLLRCPDCFGALDFDGPAVDRRATDGVLHCPACRAAYPVRRGIPRFVPDRTYADSFAVEWRAHARTQYDSYSGRPLSQKRFFRETGWSQDLSGQSVLEAGCGSGRFTEVAVQTGASVVSFDLSAAVDVNYEANGHHPNLLVLQAGAERLPLPRASFDKVFCFGVLQHTPDPRDTFLRLTQMLKPGGEIVADVYRWTFWTNVLGTKYIVRRVTSRMEPRRLYALTRRWVDLWWPVTRQLLRIPRVGRAIAWRLLIADYSTYGLSGSMLKEWTYLDTFDVLAPTYDRPQRLEAVREWVRAAGLTHPDVRYGYNGIEIRGRRPD